jgi:hypothetical protein
LDGGVVHHIVRVLFVAAFACLLTIGSSLTASAASISIMIGDADAFNGTQPGAILGSSVNPNLFIPLGVPAGTYTNLTDFATQSPWGIYVFNYNFNFDTTALSSITSATVTIRSGSIGNRDATELATGFGPAPVKAGLVSPTVSLGILQPTSTGVTGSALEEQVKDHVFDVSSIITAGLVGTLFLQVDGTTLTNHQDLFSFDYAVLTIEGAPAPLPSTLVLFASGLGAMGLLGRRRNRRKLAPLSGR